MNLRIVPIDLSGANWYVGQWHRHHKPVVGHRFSLACLNDGVVVGVAIVGRPVARLAGHPLEVLEVTRVATDGTPNACSKLYGAAARAGRAIGYRLIQTYTLINENGASLRAAGWREDGITKGRQWRHTDGGKRRTDQPVCDKRRWVMELNPQWTLAVVGASVPVVDVS